MVTEFWNKRKVATNILGILVFLISLITTGTLFKFVFKDLNTRFISLVAVFVASVFTVQFFDKKSLHWLGIGFHTWVLRECVLGFAFGFVVASLACLPSLFFIEKMSMNLNIVSAPLSFIFNSFLLSVVLRFAWAILEELTYRGYLFQRSIEIFGVGVSTLSFALLFAVSHLWNPDSNWLSSLNTFLAGIFFSLMYIKSGSLFMPIFAHATWNCVLGDLFGLPVSGLNNLLGSNLMTIKLATTNSTQNLFITGGDYGPEQSLVCSIALLLGIIFLAKSKLVRVSPYVYARVFDLQKSNEN